jgi:hypothetical protein
MLPDIGRLTVEELLRRAVEADELAELVSSGVDKERLNHRASVLRQRALELLDGRRCGPGDSQELN